LKTISTLMAVLLLACMAAASTVTFDSYSPLDTCGSPVSSEGLTFTDSSGTGGCAQPFLYVWDGSSPNGNGTPALIYGYGAGYSVDVTKTGGGVFTLNSAQMTISWYDSNPTEVIPVVAHLAGGGTTTDFITLMQGLQTYTFNFGNVTSVDFGGIANGYWLMDNVNFGNGSSVPEPGTLAMFGAGLLGVGRLARKRLGKS